MRTLSMVAVLVAVIASQISPVMADETSKALALADKNKNALAMVSVTITNELTKKEQSFAGVAFCIDAKQRLFVTLAISPNLSLDMIKEIVTISPGLERKKLKSKFLGVDTGTGIGFFQVTEDSKWGEIEFASSSNLSAGDLVTSVGLMTNIATFPPYVGAAYVSAQLRIPDHLVRVTGGSLTSSGSPVFNSKGQAIGIVSRQVSEGWQVQGQRGLNKVPMQGETSTFYFWPVEEFIHAWRNLPTGGNANPLSWIGVVSFSDVSESAIKAWGLDVAAVKIDDVVAGYSAANKGLKKDDVIIAVDGKKLEELGTAQLTRLNFVRKLMRAKAGTQIKLTIKRDSEEKVVTVTTTEQPKGPGAAARYANQRIGLLVRDRMKIEKEVNPEIKDDGVVVLGTAQSSAAAGAGLKPGDVIFLVDGKPCKTTDVFSQLLEAALKDKNLCEMKIHRGEGDRDIVVRPVGQ